MAKKRFPAKLAVTEVTPEYVGPWGTGATLSDPDTRLHQLDRRTEAVLANLHLAIQCENELDKRAAGALVPALAAMQIALAKELKILADAYERVRVEEMIPKHIEDEKKY